MIAAYIALALPIVTPMPESYTERLPDHLVEFKMIYVPAGKVNIRGQEVEVKAFYISETEVTWDLYDVYYLRLDMTPEQREANHDAASRPSRPYGAVDRGYGHKGYPAIGVAAPASEVFCKWLEGKFNRPYRIPNEAEWEYAARANAPLPEKWDDYAVFWDTSEDKTEAVKSKKPNAWGLFDMIGNASEWVKSLDDPSVMTTAGGHFNYEGPDLGPSLREPYTIKWQDRDPQVPKSRWWLSDGPQVGFRIVVSADQVKLEQ